MECKLKKCSNNVETEDGYCDKHGYYSSTSKEHITKHIQNYIGKINNGKTASYQIRISNNLFFYLTHKKDFFEKNKHFHSIVISKGDEFYKKMEDRDSKYKEQFKVFLNTIKEFNI